MAFKSTVSDCLNRLCDFLCGLGSVSESAGDSTHHGSLEVAMETVYSVTFRAVSALVRLCSSLLYTPVTGGKVASGMEKLVNHFLLPRELYELDKRIDKQRSGAVGPAEGLGLPVVAQEYMRDQLLEVRCSRYLVFSFVFTLVWWCAATSY